VETKCVWLQIFALPLFDYVAISILVLGICYPGLDVFGNMIKEILIPVCVICRHDIFGKKKKKMKEAKFPIVRPIVALFFFFFFFFFFCLCSIV
jgi:hypothetical protein